MGRFLLGLGILVILLALCLSVTVLTQRSQASICHLLEEAAQLALAGKTDISLSLIGQAQQRWQRQWHRVAAYSQHDPMDEIDSLFAQLEAYGRGGYGVHMAAMCGRLAQLIDAIADAQCLTWWNLL